MRVGLVNKLAKNATDHMFPWQFTEMNTLHSLRGYLLCFANISGPGWQD